VAMARIQGILRHWDDAKGYGFIQPMDGSNEAFLHIKSLPHYQRRPHPGDILTYEEKLDENKRIYASSPKIKKFAYSFFTLICLSLFLLFALYVCLVLWGILPFHFLSIYAAMSLLTIWVYSLDKSAARKGLQRTPEKKMHLLEIAGGWPGALLAQIFFRHKIQKVSYQLIFWLIVIGHGVGWYVVLTDREKLQPYQNAAQRQLQAMAHNIKQEISRLVGNENHATYSLSSILENSGKPDTDSHLLKRSKATVARNTVIAEGIIKEILPEKGLLVTLKSGTEGIIPRSTLVNDFSKQFMKGEHIRISMSSIPGSDKNSLEFILVE
jgi:uncharacterized membrane protein YsdA (DUF1294 family)/cold shock CspA family protein